LPQLDAPKARCYLYPDEDLRIMKCKKVPPVERLLLGLLNREGPRVAEAGQLQFLDLDLDHNSVELDETKTGVPRSWALDPSTAEALGRWHDRFRPDAKPEDYVFTDDNGDPIDTNKLAKRLREYAVLAGVTRPQLVKRTKKRIPLRAHDLRASFVTVKLAMGKSETWVTDRTGHQSSIMLMRYYRRDARKHAEMGLGDFTPLCEAIPELGDR